MQRWWFIFLLSYVYRSDQERSRFDSSIIFEYNFYICIGGNFGIKVTFIDGVQ